MTVFDSALLTDRGVVAVTGPDAAKLLQGLVTNDIPGEQKGAAAFAGLLSPQGKIQFDFLIVRTSDGFILDVAQDKAADLAKRLTLYRLRSKVDIAVRDDLVVFADWSPAAQALPPDRPFPDAYADARLPELGWRRTLVAADTPVHSGQSASEAAYHAHRIALGVPDGGRDYAYGDTFPHEALYDQLRGVSFEKGCYVGQEIVSRMQHRGTARKRIVKVEGAATLPAPGTPITAGTVEIGTLGSTDGTQGLALVRLDRAAEFKTKGIPLKAGTVTVSIAKPAYATFALEPPTSAVTPS